VTPYRRDDAPFSFVTPPRHHSCRADTPTIREVVSVRGMSGAAAAASSPPPPRLRPLQLFDEHDVALMRSAARGPADSQSLPWLVCDFHRAFVSRLLERNNEPHVQKSSHAFKDDAARADVRWEDRLWPKDEWQRCQAANDKMDRSNPPPHLPFGLQAFVKLISCIDNAEQDGWTQEEFLLVLVCGLLCRYHQLPAEDATDAVARHLRKTVLVDILVAANSYSILVAYDRHQPPAAAAADVQQTKRQCADIALDLCTYFAMPERWRTWCEAGRELCIPTGAAGHAIYVCLRFTCVAFTSGAHLPDMDSCPSCQCDIRIDDQAKRRADDSDVVMTQPVGIVQRDHFTRAPTELLAFSSQDARAGVGPYLAELMLMRAQQLNPKVAKDQVLIKRLLANGILSNAPAVPRPPATVVSTADAWPVQTSKNCCWENYRVGLYQRSNPPGTTSGERAAAFNRDFASPLRSWAETIGRSARPAPSASTLAQNEAGVNVNEVAQQIRRAAEATRTAVEEADRIAQTMASRRMLQAIAAVVELDRNRQYSILLDADGLCAVLPVLQLQALQKRLAIALNHNFVALGVQRDEVHVGALFDVWYASSTGSLAAALLTAPNREFSPADVILLFGQICVVSTPDPAALPADFQTMQQNFHTAVHSLFLSNARVLRIAQSSFSSCTSKLHLTCPMGNGGVFHLCNASALLAAAPMRFIIEALASRNLQLLLQWASLQKTSWEFCKLYEQAHVHAVIGAQVHHLFDVLLRQKTAPCSGLETAHFVLSLGAVVGSTLDFLLFDHPDADAHVPTLISAAPQQQPTMPPQQLTHGSIMSLATRQWLASIAFRVANGGSVAHWVLPFRIESGNSLDATCMFESGFHIVQPLVQFHTEVKPLTAPSEAPDKVLAWLSDDLVQLAKAMPEAKARTMLRLAAHEGIAPLNTDLDLDPAPKRISLSTEHQVHCLFEAARLGDCQAMLALAKKLLSVRLTRQRLPAAFVQKPAFWLYMAAMSESDGEEEEHSKGVAAMLLRLQAYASTPPRSFLHYFALLLWSSDSDRIAQLESVPLEARRSMARQLWTQAADRNYPPAMFVLGVQGDRQRLENAHAMHYLPATCELGLQMLGDASQRETGVAWLELLSSLRHPVATFVYLLRKFYSNAEMSDEEFAQTLRECDAAWKPRPAASSSMHPLLLCLTYQLQAIAFVGSRARRTRGSPPDANLLSLARTSIHRCHIMPCHQLPGVLTLVDKLEKLKELQLAEGDDIVERAKKCSMVRPPSLAALQHSRDGDSTLLDELTVVHAPYQVAYVEWLSPPGAQPLTPTPTPPAWGGMSSPQVADNADLRSAVRKLLPLAPRLSYDATAKHVCLAFEQPQQFRNYFEHHLVHLQAEILEQLWPIFRQCQIDVPVTNWLVQPTFVCHYRAAELELRPAQASRPSAHSCLSFVLQVGSKYWAVFSGHAVMKEDGDFLQLLQESRDAAQPDGLSDRVFQQVKLDIVSKPLQIASHRFTSTLDYAYAAVSDESDVERLKSDCSPSFSGTLSSLRAAVASVKLSLARSSGDGVAAELALAREPFCVGVKVESIGADALFSEGILTDCCVTRMKDDAVKPGDSGALLTVPDPSGGDRRIPLGVVRCTVDSPSPQRQYSAGICELLMDLMAQVKEPLASRFTILQPRGPGMVANSESAQSATDDAPLPSLLWNASDALMLSAQLGFTPAPLDLAYRSTNTTVSSSSSSSSSSSLSSLSTALSPAFTPARPVSVGDLAASSVDGHAPETLHAFPRVLDYYMHHEAVLSRISFTWPSKEAVHVLATDCTCLALSLTPSEVQERALLALKQMQLEFHTSKLCVVVATIAAKSVTVRRGNTTLFLGPRIIGYRVSPSFQLPSASMRAVESKRSEPVTEKSSDGGSQTRPPTKTLAAASVTTPSGAEVVSRTSTPSVLSTLLSSSETMPLEILLFSAFLNADVIQLSVLKQFFQARLGRSDEPLFDHAMNVVLHAGFLQPGAATSFAMQQQVRDALREFHDSADGAALCGQQWINAIKQVLPEVRTTLSDFDSKSEASLRELVLQHSCDASRATHRPALPLEPVDFVAWLLSHDGPIAHLFKSPASSLVPDVLALFPAPTLEQLQSVRLTHSIWKAFIQLHASYPRSPSLLVVAALACLLAATIQAWRVLPDAAEAAPEPGFLRELLELDHLLQHMARRPARAKILHLLRAVEDRVEADYGGSKIVEQLKRWLPLLPPSLASSVARGLRDIQVFADSLRAPLPFGADLSVSEKPLPFVPASYTVDASQQLRQLEPRLFQPMDILREQLGFYVAGTALDHLNSLEEELRDAPGGKRCIWLQGESGTGKTVLLAELCNRQAHACLGVFFFKDNGERARWFCMLRSLAFQMAQRVPAYREALLQLLAQRDVAAQLPGMRPVDLFRVLFVAPLRRGKLWNERPFVTFLGDTAPPAGNVAEPCRCFFVIDALNESESCRDSSLLQLLEHEASDLPTWLALVVSTTDSTRRAIHIQAAQADLNRCITQRLDELQEQTFRTGGTRRIEFQQKVQEQVKHLPNGKFIYLRLLLDDLKHEINWGAGEASRSMLTVPVSLDELIDLTLKRLQESPSRRWNGATLCAASVRDILDVLGVLVVAREQLSAANLSNILQRDEQQIAVCLQAVSVWTETSTAHNDDSTVFVTLLHTCVRDRLQRLPSLCEAAVHLRVALEGWRQLSAAPSSYANDDTLLLQLPSVQHYSRACEPVVVLAVDSFVDRDCRWGDLRSYLARFFVHHCIQAAKKVNIFPLLLAAVTHLSYLHIRLHAERSLWRSLEGFTAEAAVGHDSELTHMLITELREMREAAQQLQGDTRGFVCSQLDVMDSFLRVSLHHFIAFPHLVYQDAYAYPNGSLLHLRAARLKSWWAPQYAWVEWLNKPGETESEHCRAVLVGHFYRVNCALFLGDKGHDAEWRVISGSRDCTVRLWDGRTGRMCGLLSPGHDDAVLTLARHPSLDVGFSGSLDGTICVFDLSTLRRKGVVVCKPTDAFSSGSNASRLGVMVLAVSPAGDWLAAVVRKTKGAHKDDVPGEVVLHRVHSDGGLAVPLSVAVDSWGQRWFPWCIAWSPKGKHLVVSSEDTLLLLEPQLASGSEGGCIPAIIRQRFCVHRKRIRVLACSPPSSDSLQWLLTGSDDMLSFLFAWSAEELLLPVAYVPFDQQCATASRIRCLTIAGAGLPQTAASSDSVPAAAARASASAAIAFERVRFAAGFLDNSVRVYELQLDPLWRSDNTVLDRQTRRVKLRQLAMFLGHVYTVQAVCFSPDATCVLSSSMDRQMKIWRIPPASALRPFPGHHDSITSLDVVADGRRIVSGGTDGSVRIWDLNPVMHVQTHVLRGGHVSKVLALAVTPFRTFSNGYCVVSAGADRMVNVWRLSDGAHLAALVSGHSEPVLAIAVHPTRPSLLASVSDDCTVRVWHVPPGQKASCLLALCHDPVPMTAVDFLPPQSTSTVTRNQDLLLTGNSHGRVQFWRLSSEASRLDREFEGAAEAATGTGKERHSLLLDQEVCRGAIEELHAMHARDLPQFLVRAAHSQLSVWKWSWVGDAHTKRLSSIRISLQWQRDIAGDIPPSPLQGCLSMARLSDDSILLCQPNLFSIMSSFSHGLRPRSIAAPLAPLDLSTATVLRCRAVSIAAGECVLFSGHLTGEVGQWHLTRSHDGSAIISFTAKFADGLERITSLDVHDGPGSQKDECFVAIGDACGRVRVLRAAALQLVCVWSRDPPMGVPLCLITCLRWQSDRLWVAGRPHKPRDNSVLLAFNISLGACVAAPDKRAQAADYFPASGLFSSAVDACWKRPEALPRDLSSLSGGLGAAVTFASGSHLWAWIPQSRLSESASLFQLPTNEGQLNSVSWNSVMCAESTVGHARVDVVGGQMSEPFVAALLTGQASTPALEAAELNRTPRWSRGRAILSPDQRWLAFSYQTTSHSVLGDAQRGSFTVALGEVPTTTPNGAPYLLRRNRVLEPELSITTLKFSSSSRFLVVGTQSSSVLVFAVQPTNSDTVEPLVLLCRLRLSSGRVNSCHLSECDVSSGSSAFPFLACATMDSTLRVFDVSQLELRVDALTGEGEAQRIFHFPNTRSQEVASCQFVCHPAAGGHHSRRGGPTLPPVPPVSLLEREPLYVLEVLRQLHRACVVRGKRLGEVDLSSYQSIHSLECVEQGGLERLLDVANCCSHQDLPSPYSAALLGKVWSLLIGLTHVLKARWLDQAVTTQEEARRDIVRMDVVLRSHLSMLARLAKTSNPQPDQPGAAEAAVALLEARFPLLDPFAPSADDCTFTLLSADMEALIGALLERLLEQDTRTFEATAGAPAGSRGPRDGAVVELKAAAATEVLLQVLSSLLRYWLPDPATWKREGLLRWRFLFRFAEESSLTRVLQGLLSRVRRTSGNQLSEQTSVPAAAAQVLSGKALDEVRKAEDDLHVACDHAERTVAAAFVREGAAALSPAQLQRLEVIAQALTTPSSSVLPLVSSSVLKTCLQLWRAATDLWLNSWDGLRWHYAIIRMVSVAVPQKKMVKHLAPLLRLLPVNVPRLASFSLRGDFVFLAALLELLLAVTRMDHPCAFDLAGGIQVWLQLLEVLRLHRSVMRGRQLLESKHLQLFCRLLSLFGLRRWVAAELHVSLSSEVLEAETLRHLENRWRMWGAQTVPHRSDLDTISDNPLSSSLTDVLLQRAQAIPYLLSLYPPLPELTSESARRFELLSQVLYEIVVAFDAEPEPLHPRAVVPVDQNPVLPLLRQPFRADSFEPTKVPALAQLLIRFLLAPARGMFLYVWRLLAKLLTCVEDLADVSEGTCASIAELAAAVCRDAEQPLLLRTDAHNVHAFVTIARLDVTFHWLEKSRRAVAALSDASTRMSGAAALFALGILSQSSDLHKHLSAVHMRALSPVGVCDAAAVWGQPAQTLDIGRCVHRVANCSFYAAVVSSDAPQPHSAVTLLSVRLGRATDHAAVQRHLLACSRIHYEGFASVQAAWFSQEDVREVSSGAALTPAYSAESQPRFLHILLKSRIVRYLAADLALPSASSSPPIQRRVAALNVVQQVARTVLALEIASSSMHSEVGVHFLHSLCLSPLTLMLDSEGRVLVLPLRREDFLAATLSDSAAVGRSVLPYCGVDSDTVSERVHAYKRLPALLWFCLSSHHPEPREESGELAWMRMMRLRTDTPAPLRLLLVSQREDSPPAQQLTLYLYHLHVAKKWLQQAPLGAPGPLMKLPTAQATESPGPKSASVVGDSVSGPWHRMFPSIAVMQQFVAQLREMQASRKMSAAAAKLSALLVSALASGLVLPVLHTASGIRSVNVGWITAVAGQVCGVPERPISEFGDFNAAFDTLAHGDERMLMQLFGRLSSIARQRIERASLPLYPSSATLPSSPASAPAFTCSLLPTQHHLFEEILFTLEVSNLPALLGVYDELCYANFDLFGEEAVEAYKRGHAAALHDAWYSQDPRKQAEQQRSDLLTALAKEVFAMKFLFSLFAPGHLRNPRRALQRFMDNLLPPAAATKVSWLLSSIMHEEDGQYGVYVRSSASNRVWLCVGDLLAPNAKETLEAMVNAALAGVHDVFECACQAAAAGEAASPGPPVYSALDHRPVPSPAPFGVVAHTPLFAFYSVPGWGQPPGPPSLLVRPGPLRSTQLVPLTVAHLRELLPEWADELMAASRSASLSRGNSGSGASIPRPPASLVDAQFAPAAGAVSAPPWVTMRSLSTPAAASSSTSSSHAAPRARGPESNRWRVFVGSSHITDEQLQDLFSSAGPCIVQREGGRVYLSFTTEAARARALANPPHFNGHRLRVEEPRSNGYWPVSKTRRKGKHG